MLPNKDLDQIIKDLHLPLSRELTDLEFTGIVNRLASYTVAHQVCDRLAERRAKQSTKRK